MPHSVSLIHNQYIQIGIGAICAYILSALIGDSVAALNLIPFMAYAQAYSSNEGATRDVEVPKRQRVTWFSFICLFVIALAFDAAGFVKELMHILPVLGTLLALMLGMITWVVKFGFFTITFMLMGVSILFSKQIVGGLTKAMARGAIRFIVWVTSIVIEATPFLEMLPMTTIWVTVVLAIAALEDTEYNTNMQAALDQAEKATRKIERIVNVTNQAVKVGRYVLK